MPKQKQRPRQLDSLIPTIKTEERRLDDLLADARARAEQTVKDARAEAASRIESNRASLPALVKSQREARWPELERGAAAASADEEARVRTVETRARTRMDETVRFIVSLVWPKGRRP